MLYRNDVYELDGQRERLLDAVPGENKAWVINLSDEDSFPKVRNLPELLELEDTPRLVRIELGTASPIARRASDAAKAKRHQAWFRIEPLVKTLEIYDSKKRSKLIQARAKEVGCTAFTIYKDLRRYWHGGQTIDALIPDFHSCGRSITGATAGRGRTPKSGHYPIYQLQSEDIVKIKAFIEKEYLRGEVGTMDSAFQTMLEKRYNYLDGNGQNFLLPRGERPTLRQFQHILNTHYTDEHRIRRRKGDKAFEQNHRPRLGSAQDDCLGVGHIYEIDATVADVYLVSSENRSLIIGKPSLYLIYDRRSRLVVGWYLGFEAPSWPAAMQAILCIAEDKAAMCRRHGAEYNASDWPAHGVFPESFLGDLGEMVSKNSSLVVEGLGITVMNAPALRPDYKGTVECGFKLIQRSMAPTTPGYEPPENVTKRRGKKYDKDASLNLDEFKGLLLRNIIAHNRRIMTGYPVTIDMVADGIQAISRDIWAYEAPKRMGVLTRYGEAHVRFSLLPHDQATVTSNGIEFKNCFYSCPEAVEGGWFVRAGKGNFKKAISYDRRLVDTIYLHDAKDPTKFVIATLLEKSRRFKGMSFAEVEAYDKLVANMHLDADHHNRQVMADYHTYAEPVTSSALKDAKKVSKGKSRTSRKADIAEDRLRERRAQRQDEARMPVEAKPVSASTNNVVALNPMPRVPVAPDAEPLSDAPLTLEEKLRRKRQEMLNANQK